MSRKTLTRQKASTEKGNRFHEQKKKIIMPCYEKKKSAFTINCLLNEIKSVNVYYKAYQPITACVKWSDRSGAATRRIPQAARTYRVQ